MYEVESKYRVADPAALGSELARLGAAFSEGHFEVDQYYAHPCRDFAATDEALRIRRAGRDSFLTYKGKKLDETTKTRREIELPLPRASDWHAGLADLLDALGFRPVAEVRKTRRKASLPWHGQHVELALDEVVDLGLFLELELKADDSGLDAARALLGSLAAELKLSGGERRSYLELLLAAQATNASQ